MKIFFWLLVLANVIFFAVMKSGLFDEEQSGTALAPLNAEQIALASEAPVSAIASKPVPASAPASAVPATEVACFEWGEFSGADIDLASKELGKLKLGNKVSRHDVEHHLGYWVYIPPVKDKTAVAEKIKQLKARGVTDYFVVQDQGEWMNAISLGVFKTKDAADSFLEGLRKNGVRSARLGEKSSKSPAAVFEIKDADAETGDRLAKLQQDFFGSVLKRVSCH
jgi:hypothetical protein